MPRITATLPLLLVLLSVQISAAQVKTLNVRFKTDEGEMTSIGEVVAEYGDGSLVLLTPDGQLWELLNEQILSREATDEEMQPLSSEEIFAQFKEQLPPGFSISKTKHYVFVHNTSEAYARWVGQLFERLHRGFYNYWGRSLKLEEPRFPLVAVIFRDKASYLQYSERRIGESARAMIGFYNIKSNRVITYDLTGIDGMVPPGVNVPSSRLINQVLSRPQAERTVATIVHEAVHQIAYNSGMQTRMADNPLWLSEGMAMFFESPDFKAAQGWAMGKVNYHNLRLFGQYLPSRPADSLTTLLADDTRFRQQPSASKAYSESWALTYFLIKTKRKQYAAYIKELSELPAMGETSARERIDVFKKHFGEDLSELDQKFIRYMRTSVR